MAIMLKIQKIGIFSKEIQIAYSQIDQGWVFGTNYDDERKTHPKLKPYHLLDEDVRYRDQRYRDQF